MPSATILISFDAFQDEYTVTDSDGDLESVVAGTEEEAQAAAQEMATHHRNYGQPVTIRHATA